MQPQPRSLTSPPPFRLLIGNIGLVLCLIAVTLAAPESVAQSGAGGSSRADEAAAQKLAAAMKALQSGENQVAADTLKSVVSLQPTNGRAWNALGTALLNLDDLDGAIRALEQAETHSAAKAFVRYNLACAEARAMRPDKALQWLDSAVIGGFSNVQQLKTDPDLESIRARPAFAKVLEAADRNARPCVYDAKSRQFDFWLGVWNVFDSQGRQVGRNSIRQDLNGCVLHENWTSAAGGAGQSVNYFDPETDSWVQHWIDGSGGNIQLRGSFTDGSMRLEGKNVTRGQPTEAIRGTWTLLPDGRVRQLFEQSRDGGESWYVWFDGYYVKQPAEAGSEG